MSQLQISNEFFDNFVYPDFVSNLTIVEKAYGILPSFVLSFMDTDKDKIRYLNELNPITISFTYNNKDYSSNWVIKYVKVTEGAQGFSAMIAGYLNAFEYYKNSNVPYVVGTSQDVINQISSQYFTLKDSAPTPDDSMNWLSFGRPDRRFLNDAWKHSYIEDDFTLIGIDSQSNFIRTSLLTRMNDNYKILFSNINTEEGITYQYVKPTASSLDTSLFGYPCVRDILHEDTGELEECFVDPKVLLTPSPKLNMSSAINRVVLPPLYQSTNTHKNYQKARNHNFITLSNLMNNSIEIGCHGVPDLGLLDLLRLETDFEPTRRKSFDGLYVTSGIRRVLDNTGSIFSYFTATREVSEEIV